MSGWHNVYITDKSGKKYFNVIASPMSTHSEIKNLSRYIEEARKFPKYYQFLDIDSMVLIVDGMPYNALTNEDDEILKELGM